MKRGLFFLFCAISMLLSALSSACADNLIEPGVRIDGIFFNMDYSLVQRGWGTAEQKEELANGVTLYKNVRYLTIFYVKDDRLAMVETFSRSFKTTAGIKVGVSTRFDVAAAYGAPLDQENYSFTGFDGTKRDLYSLIYKSLGIGFSFDPESQIVQSIIVFPSAKYVDILGK